jgi:hypothetical protein
VRSGWKLYAVAGAAVAAEIAAHLVWRPTMLRWGTQANESTEPLPGDELVPRPRVQSTRAITIDAPPAQVWPWIVQMGIGRAGFYTHDRVERLMFHARYADGKHSAIRIHPELQDLKVGDLVPYGAGAYAPVHELEPNQHLVAGEVFVLRPLPGNRTRLIVRSRGTGYITAAVEAVDSDAPPLTKAISSIVRNVPGAKLVARGLDFLVGDPLHHYMETGVLRGTKARAEGKYGHAIGADARRRPPPWNPWRPRADGASTQVAVRPRPTVVAAIKVFHTLAWLTIESCVAYVLWAGFAGRSDRRVGVAAAVVAGETLVFAGNGFRCPLTGLAERYGAEHGSVTDIYLPKWFAHNMPAIHAPLLMLMAYLHARNLIRPHKALAATGGSLSTCSGRCQTEPVRRTPHRRTDANRFRPRGGTRLLHSPR